jgi:hypothetical protein
MAFKCVHCKTTIEDDSLKLPRSGTQCPKCKKDPTEGWSPYHADVAEKGRKAADEANLRLMTTGDFGVREAALWFLEDIVLEGRNELSIRIGHNPDRPQKCSVCNEHVPPGEGFRLELFSKWRSTFVAIGLCERHTGEGLWAREVDIQRNHPDAWVTRGDWHYPPSTREQHK